MSSATGPFWPEPDPPVYCADTQAGQAWTLGCKCCRSHCLMSSTQASCKKERRQLQVHAALQT